MLPGRLILISSHSFKKLNVLYNDAVMEAAFIYKLMTKAYWA